MVAHGLLSKYQAKVLLSGRAGPFVFGDYLMHDRFGEGRFKGTFRGVHLPTRSRVLLSFHSGAAVQNPKNWARLVKYTTQTIKAVNPHVSRIYQLCDLGHYKFTVLEELEGQEAEERLKAGPIPFREACSIVHQVAEGLDQLLHLGILHGELRPANIWILPDGNAKLLLPPLARDPSIVVGPIDFRQADPSGHLLAAADYAAPELAQAGNAPGVRSEIYALGCSLVELINGAPPFAGGDVQSKLARHASSEPSPPLSSLAVPKPVAAVIARMMAKNPAERFQIPQDVIAALTAAVDQNAKVIEAASVATESAAATAGALPAAEPAKVVAVQSATEAKSLPANLSPAGDIDLLEAFETPASVAAATNVKSAASAGGGSAEAKSASPAKIEVFSAATSGSSAVGAPPSFSSGLPMSLPTAAMLPPEVVGVFDPALTAPTRTKRPPSRSLVVATLVLLGCLVVVMIVALVILARRGDEAPATAPGANPSDANKSPDSDKTKSPDAALDGKNSGAAAGRNEKSDRAAPDKLAVVEVSARDGPNDSSLNDRDSNARGDNVSRTDPTAADERAADEHKSLWASPTSGRPISLEYVAPCAQVFLYLRPAEVLKHPEGEKLLAALGPAGSSVWHEWEELIGGPLSDVDSVLVAWVERTGAEANPPIAPMYVFRFTKPIDQTALLEHWKNPAATKQGSEQIYACPSGFAYLPGTENGKVLVAGGKTEVEASAQQGKTTPPLHREIERLLQTSDATRLATLLCVPDYLFSHAKLFFVGPLAALVDPAESFLGSDCRALALSTDLSKDDLFLELRMQGPLGRTPELVAKEIDQRYATLPDTVAKFLASFTPQEYGKALLERYPAMLRAGGIYALRCRAQADCAAVLSAVGGRPQSTHGYRTSAGGRMERGNQRTCGRLASKRNGRPAAQTRHFAGFCPRYTGKHDSNALQRNRGENGNFGGRFATGGDHQESIVWFGREKRASRRNLAQSNAESQYRR